MKQFLEMGGLVGVLHICFAVANDDEEATRAYLKSGMQVKWDAEMNCISSSEHMSRVRAKTSPIIDSVIREMEKQFYPDAAPYSIYHGFKLSDRQNKVTHG